MHFNDLCTANVYEVLEGDIQKYTTTTVSGGGGYGGNVSEVRSTTEHHSDQTLWLKNVDTGEEKKFEFTTFNIPARTGHYLYIVFSRKNNDIVRVVNLNTKDTYVSEGALSHKKTSFLLSIVNAALFGFSVAMPGLQILALLGTFGMLRPLKEVANTPTDLKSAVAKYEPILMIILGGLFLYSIYAFFASGHKPVEKVVTLTFLSTIPLTYLYVKLNKKVDPFLLDVTKIVNDHVAKFVNDYKH